MSAAVLHPTLADRLFRGQSSRVRQVLLAFGGSLALWASAKIQIPFYPVPLTMQTFMVLVIGMAFGPRLGTATVGLYLLQGALGLPVFAGTPEKGIGLAYMAGPTGGYLIGYLAAAAACGFLAERGWDRKVSTTALAMIAGNALIYVPGLLRLGAVVGWDKPVLAWGLTPFLLGDLVKLALAAALLPLAWQGLRNR
ncbi:biotin transporter BioY [Mesorhizobium sp. L-8-10]|uniref:biotin transporter BioY n=1 Tax=Mesorhizobium sp. L-8-10 TaxID=2744523 RepID=UPI0019279498|nr:biotin transporter BioY [Mesorhizobium sp. L-8-10]BCH35499.1 biotin transporter BioY [Mesorhizobium sp. L-8-10]